MAISIISLVIAAIALTLTVRREVLDRPQLYVIADPTATLNGQAEIVFTVENRGRRPVTVGTIGRPLCASLSVTPLERRGAASIGG